MQSLVDCHTVTKYSSIFCPNFNKYFVEFIQQERSHIFFQHINVWQVPREMLKTSAYDIVFQHLPQDRANFNAWKTMFDPYIILDQHILRLVTVIPRFDRLCLRLLARVK